MISYIKNPVSIAILILFIYMIAIILWNVDLTLGALLLVIFVNSGIGVFGSLSIVREIINTNKKKYIPIYILCLLLAVVAALVPFIAFIYVDIYGL